MDSLYRSNCFLCSSGPPCFNCVWQVRVVAAEGEMQGGSRIVDLHNGLYEVFYTAPATGAFLVHVEYADAGLNPVPVGIRGSPFAVECTDPWTKYRVLGALPARRQVCTATWLQVCRSFLTTAANLCHDEQPVSCQHPQYSQPQHNVSARIS
jgi:hypothetical protein